MNSIKILKLNFFQTLLQDGFRWSQQKRPFKNKHPLEKHGWLILPLKFKLRLRDKLC